VLLKEERHRVAMEGLWQQQQRGKPSIPRELEPIRRQPQSEHQRVPHEYGGGGRGAEQWSVEDSVPRQHSRSVAGHVVSGVYFRMRSLTNPCR